MADNPRFVRVRDKRTGRHYTVSPATAKKHTHLDVLKESGVDVNGNPLPPRPAPKHVEKSTTTSAPEEAKK